MKNRTTILFALLIVPLAACGNVPDDQSGKLKDSYSFDSVVSPKVIPWNPGASPAFVAADYVPYDKPGRQGLMGSTGVRTSDGVWHSCMGETVFLYPDTPYVEWMLAKYFYFVYKTGHDAWYSDPAALVGAPDILYKPFHKPLANWNDVRIQKTSSSVVRQAECTEETTGVFQFKDLPAGRYIPVANVRVFITTSSSVINSQLGVSAYGDVAPVYSYGVEHGSGLNDGWWVTTKPMLIPSDGQTRVLADTSPEWFTVAHMSGGNTYDPKVPYPQ